MNQPIPPPYRVFETRPFLDHLQDLQTPMTSKITEKLKSQVYPQLRHQPHFGPNIKKLRDWEPETWRYRIGPWRVFYEIGEKDRVVYITAMDLRRDAYS